MKIIRYRTFKRHLEFFLNKASIDHTPLVVIMKNGRDVVVLSKTDYETMQNIFYPSGPDQFFIREVKS